MTQHRTCFFVSENNSWQAIVACIAPVLIYWFIFFRFSLNVNYIAYDDTLILSILPSFETASWYERWKLLSGLFPEHRLVFSRSIVLLTHKIFGKVDLTYLMFVANICYTACAWIFYKAFKHFKLSLWYFVPVVWIWLSIQAFENMFWGVSSLCNFGVLLFTFTSFYYACFEENKPWKALFFAFLATFTYGNGLFSFFILVIIFWFNGNKTNTLLTLIVLGIVTTIYFIDFKPITQNLDLTNLEQVKQGFFGFFGFIGAVTTLSAYESRSVFKYFASVSGMAIILTFLWIFRNYLSNIWKSFAGKSVQIPSPLRFVLALALFIVITAMATAYKRIPMDTFDGMFKGRYRMYSVLSLVGLYFGILYTLRFPLKCIFLFILIPFSILFNLTIIYFNIDSVINNSRQALTQEFNSRYNADWLGLAMFDMDQHHFEKIRSYYQSDDPLANGWNPANKSDVIHCEGNATILESFISPDGNLYIKIKEKAIKPINGYYEGSYVILKSAQNTYISSPHQKKGSIKSFVKEFKYLNPQITGIFHTATIQPGSYKIYVLESLGGQNKLLCTGQTWVEND